MHILQPSAWAKPRGYSNGIAARGQVIFVSGQIGWDENARFVSSEFLGQARQALKNIVAVLAEADATPDRIARMTWYITDKAEYRASLKDVGRVYREVIGAHYPAMTLVQVAALLEDRAKVEIEATAVLPQP